MSKSVLNLPNMITMFRFPASIAMLWLLMQFDVPLVDSTGDIPAISAATGYPMWIAISIALVSFLTFLSDWSDGKVARKYGIVTDFGKVMDPVADSIFFTLLLMGLAISPRFNVTIWFTVVLIFREAGVQVMRRHAAYCGVVLMAGWAGKMKMLVQCLVMAGLGFAILFTDTGIFKFSESILRSFAWWASAACALVSIWSFIAYLKQLPAMMQEQTMDEE